MGGHRDPGFLDRAGERDALDRLLSDARVGRSGVLVLRGEAGIGKSALLQYAAREASGFRVVQITGVEAESELAFAGIHQLCAPWIARVDELPGPQRDALRVALGLAPGAVPDRFLVALAVLSLLSVVAGDLPVLGLVDDAQWLDSASGQVLGFVARRLLAEHVAMLIAVRAPGPPDGFGQLPELSISGLADEDAHVLLTSVVPGRLDEHLSHRIISETGGNPLALLELPRGMTAAELAGGFGLVAAQGLSGGIEDSFVRRLDPLPDESRRLLLLAAAEPLGDPLLLWRAAELSGIDATAADALAAHGLLAIDERVTFRHPLARSAAYRSATAAERRATHLALAEATDRDIDPDRRAWHLAGATAGPDEEAASELERSASRAQARGGFAAMAAFLERSVALTDDPDRRVERALAAAGARLQCGAPEPAVALLSLVEASPLDDLQRATVHLLRGQAAFASSRGADAPPLLLAAARELEPLHPTLARDTYLDALSAALFVGRLARGTDVLDVARAARAASPSQGRPEDLLLNGLSATITEGPAVGAPLLQRAVRAFRTEDIPPADAIRWLWLATHAAHDLWDDESWAALCDRHIALARQAGALTVLPIALSARIGLHLFAGELATAASLTEEVAAVTGAMGSGLPSYGDLALAAFRGREAEAVDLIAAARVELEPRGEGMGLTLVEHASAVLFNGLGRYDEAREAAQRGAAHPQELAFSTWSLVQLVEAAARSDEPALADDALQRLTQTTRPSGTDWARGIEARSRALVSDDGVAEGFHREAVERLGRTSVRGEQARAHLLYGEWLRRQGRRSDAREQLRAAHGMLTGMGMEAYAERARRELMATGERVRARTPETRDDLTSQERQIAHLARDGLSNPEIAAQLFLSPRTVEWHLGKVFTKLGIASRRQLLAALPAM